MKKVKAFSVGTLILLLFIIGTVVYTRIILRFKMKKFLVEKGIAVRFVDPEAFPYRTIREGNLFQNVLDSLLEGGIAAGVFAHYAFMIFLG